MNWLTKLSEMIKKRIISPYYFKLDHIRSDKYLLWPWFERHAYPSQGLLEDMPEELKAICDQAIEVIVETKGSIWSIYPYEAGKIHGADFIGWHQQNKRVYCESIKTGNAALIVLDDTKPEHGLTCAIYCTDQKFDDINPLNNPSGKNDKQWDIAVKKKWLSMIGKAEKDHLDQYTKAILLGNYAMKKSQKLWLY